MPEERRQTDSMLATSAGSFGPAALPARPFPSLGRRPPPQPWGSNTEESPRPLGKEFCFPAVHQYSLMGLFRSLANSSDSAYGFPILISNIFPLSIWELFSRLFSGSHLVTIVQNWHRNKLT